MIWHKYVHVGLFVGVMAVLSVTGCKEATEQMDKVLGVERTAPVPSGAGESAENVGEEKRELRHVVAMVVAPEGYQDKEYEIPRMVFEGAGFKVEVVSFFGGTAKGALGGEAKVDVILEDVTDVVGDKYDAVVFVGGPGSVFYHKEEKAHALAKRAVESGLVVGAICLGPFILANAGVLKGHKATAWTGGKFTPGMLAARGAYFEDENVVVDDHIVTANGPDAAKEFALAVLNAVGGQQ